MIRVYIIDDDKYILQMIMDFLNSEGFLCEGTTSGENVVEKICKFKPDAIICDIIMTPINGYEIYHHVKRNLDTAHIPFIFLSSASLKQDVLKAHEMGVDDYFTKPIQLKELKERIIHVVKVSPKPRNRRIKILLADKSNVALKKFAKFFNSDCYEIKTTSSIKDALKILDTSNVDIIISATALSDADGSEFCKIVKKKYGIINFLLLTDKGDFAAINSGNKAGVDNFVFKNLGIEGLKIKLNRIIHKILDSSSWQRYKISDTDVLSVLKKCERQGLTGDLQVNSSKGSGYIEMRKGEYLKIHFNNLKEADALETMAMLSEGEIVVNYKYSLI